jgi:hypothetical protein
MAQPEQLRQFREGIRTLNTSGVEIHCIGLGRTLYGDQRFRDFLRKLAEDHRGGFAAF